MTIITTCQKLGIAPRSCMRDTLERILAGEKDLASLLPENYKPALAEQAPAAIRRRIVSALDVVALDFAHELICHFEEPRAELMGAVHRRLGQ